MSLEGKGYFIWQIDQTAPDARTLVTRAKEAGLKHVIIKIADGENPYPLKSDDENGAKEKLIADSIRALTGSGIEVWGWSYIYGTTPDIRNQARRLVQRMHQFGLEGVVINTEKLPNNPWTSDNAKAFMDELINGLAKAQIGNPQLALSTYRFPSQHPDFPFDDFMVFCQVMMPQVFWVARDGGDPVRSLQESFEEYTARYPTKEFIPVGAAFSQTVEAGENDYFWEARPDQITMFINQAAASNFPAASFWTWQSAWSKPAVWDAISSHPFTEEVKVITEAAKPVTPENDLETNTPTNQVAAVGLPDSADDDGEAIIKVGEPGYQEGIYAGTDAELVTFQRQEQTFTWVKAETTRSTAYAQWLPRITVDGEYLIEAFIPGINATTRRARYNVMGVVGQSATVVVELNQLAFSDEWVRIGIFELDGKHQFSGMVSLNNLVGAEANNDTQIAFGPIRWRKVERTGITAGFADGFDSPVGTPEERRSSKIWPGNWVDANPYLNYYFLGYHTGVDLNLPRDEDRGAPTYAIADGEVIYSGAAYNRDGSRSGFGNLIIVKHDPYRNPVTGEIIVAYSRYAHIKDIVVAKGARVRRGDHLATIWNIGTRAHHLHFDISTSGILQTNSGHWPGSRKSEVIKHYVDPFEFIKNNRPPF